MKRSIKNSNLRKSVSNLKVKKNNLLNSNQNPPVKKNKLSTKEVLINDNYNQNENLSPEKNKLSKNNNHLEKKNLKKKNKRRINRHSCIQINMTNTPNSLISSNNLSVISKKRIDSSQKNLLRKSLIFGKNKLNKEKISEKEKNKIGKDTQGENKDKKIKYIDEELNTMNYDNALIYDKRKYCEYYLSLLKKKHLIILTFNSNNDYNVFLLKFSLFILSFSLFFALNTLFFRDSTMQQINSDKGRYNFIYQIPQILYSTIISSVMTFILKKLSLSQSDLLKIKREPDKKRAKKLANNIKKCMKIKLHLFFFIGLSLIIFCWYYITAFGAVYPNTQMHLLKDTLISFLISMIYPFLMNLVPGVLRIPALKAKKKDKKCMYQFSQIIAIF